MSLVSSGGMTVRCARSVNGMRDTNTMVLGRHMRHSPGIAPRLRHQGLALYGLADDLTSSSSLRAIMVALLCVSIPSRFQSQWPSIGNFRSGEGFDDWVGSVIHGAYSISGRQPPLSFTGLPSTVPELPCFALVFSTRWPSQLRIANIWNLCLPLYSFVTDELIETTNGEGRHLWDIQLGIWHEKWSTGFQVVSSVSAELFGSIQLLFLTCSRLAVERGGVLPLHGGNGHYQAVHPAPLPQTVGAGNEAPLRCLRHPGICSPVHDRLGARGALRLPPYYQAIPLLHSRQVRC